MNPTHLVVRLPALATLALVLAACNGPRTEPVTDAAPPAVEDAGVPPATAPAPASTPPAAPEAPVPPADGQLARFDGYGDMRLGMSAEDARKAWGGELNGVPQPDSNCYYLNPKSNPAPAYFAFMIEDGKFVRYDVGNDREVAPGGGKKGMGADEIKRLYAGRVEESPHKYSDGKYLRVKDTAGSGVLVFETDAAGKVSEWHVGLAPQVDYVEGCS